MKRRIAFSTIAALGFALGVVAHAQTVRQRVPDTPRADSPSRVLPPEPSITRGAHQDPTYQVDVARLAEVVRQLEQRVLQLEAHRHRYLDAALGASRTIPIASIRGDDEQWASYEVWVVDPAAARASGTSVATQTRTTDAPSP